MSVPMNRQALILFPQLHRAYFSLEVGGYIFP
jgi:hypothetical protein